jgi:hypothetical protein
MQMKVLAITEPGIKVVGFATMHITKVDCVNPTCSPGTDNVIEETLFVKLNLDEGRECWLGQWKHSRFAQ